MIRLRHARPAAALAAVALAGGTLAACSDRENPSKSNNGPQQSNGTIETNPSTLGSATTPEKTTTSGGGGSVTSTTP